MDIELLKTFLEVEKTRHFGRAAENLYLTQAAVSARIRQLENMLGTHLFNRYRNNINLTPAGERLKPHAEAIITAWCRAVQETALSSEQSLQIAIGGTPNLWDLLLQDYLHRLYKQFPGITLRAIAQERESLTRQLVSRTLDIAILFDPPKMEELEVVRIHTIKLILVTTHKGVEFDEIFNHAYIQIDWGTSFNIQHSENLEITQPPIMHTSTGRIALDFILENGGSAYLPESIAQPFINDGQLHLLPEAPHVNRDVYTAYLKNSDKREYLEKIIQLFGAIKPESAPMLQP